MSISEHLTTFAGLPIVTYPTKDMPPDPGAVAWRVSSSEFDDGDTEFAEVLKSLTDEPWAAGVTALVIGQWEEAYDEAIPDEVLLTALRRLPALTALFLGEMTFEECEISWIHHGNITPVFAACPGLRTFAVRGASELVLEPVRHESLRSLTIESGGLPASVVAAVCASDLPALEHLELWLGDGYYGGDTDVADLAPILSGSRFPRLTSLGLKDSEIADAIAAAVAGAPVVARLRHLDLSMGVMTDAGGAALLAGQPLTHLTRLDLHHHYMSEPVLERLRAEIAAAGVDLDLSDAEGADSDERYVAVAE